MASLRHAAAVVLAAQFRVFKSNRPFGKWSRKALMQVERLYPLGHRIGEEIRGEIGRRDARNQRYALIGVIAAFVAAIVAIASLVVPHLN